MPSLNAIALGTVVIGGLALFVTGRPDARQEPAERVAAVPAYSAALDKQMKAYAAAAGPHAAAASVEVAGVRLRSVGFDLPGSETAFPAGSGAELVSNNCTACHSAGMILTQPKLTQAEWTGEVTKMINVYKAPVSAEDVGGIVTYLAGIPIAP